MAVGCEEFQLSVEIIIKEENAESEQGACGGTNAGIERFVAENKRVAGRDVEGSHFIGEIADGDGEGIIIVKASGIDAHGAASAAKFVVSNARPSPHFGESAVMIIVENKILNGVVGDHEV